MNPTGKTLFTTAIDWLHELQSVGLSTEGGVRPPLHRVGDKIEVNYRSTKSEQTIYAAIEWMTSRVSNETDNLIMPENNCFKGSVNTN